LIGHLNQGLQLGCRLALISAPAGFGKTTLLSEWTGQQEVPFAYLSLDEHDNDVQRFLAYVVAALQTVQPGIGDVAGTMLRAPEAIAPEAVLTALINDIAALDQNILLILDDLHLINDKDVHQALSYLLDHMPAQLHLVIATRADPPLPLAKLRGRGQLVELREADLRFTRDEASHFLRGIMDLALAPEETTILHGRTEGWIAGLQMAALSMQGREHPLDFVETFSGSHEYVVDYLTDEVLARQTDGRKAFLLQTSILDRLCGPLCDAVTGQQDGRQTLEQLKAANLFIASLDAERRWYRYHRLFSDLLQQRLLNRQPDAIPELHRRASRWLEENGFAFDAIYHALQAADFERAADLIEGVVKSPDQWFMLNATILMAWLDLLPEHILQARPRLRLYQARIFTVQGQAQRADAILQALEEELQEKLPVGPDSGGLLEQIAADRVSNAILRGEPLRAINYAEQALAQLPQENLQARMRFEAILGMACYQVGEATRAGRAYARAVHAAQAADIPVVTASLKTGLAKALIVQGGLREAAQLCEEACHLAELNHVRTAVAGPALTAWAKILYEQNDLQQADLLIAEGIDLLLKNGPVHGLAAAYMVRARIQQAAGQYDEAFNAIRQAAQLSQGQPAGTLSSRIPAHQARLWLAIGDFDAALSWAADYRQAVPTEYLREFEDLTLVRILLASEQLDAALSLLETLLSEAERTGRQGSAIEIFALQGLALAAKGNMVEACQPLARSLVVAGPEGYARIYIDEGAAMAHLLYKTAASGQEPDYARRLINGILAAEPGRQTSDPPPALVEPLSQRELQVLQLIEQGLSNREVAQQLVISLPTVKSHTGNIYSKLGVSSRTQAVAKARTLRLL
jgi:LuxR family maltose regulon positive regulatory protein